jgi:5'-AMP-activated protein kinase catalytic alpha subunit
LGVGAFGKVKSNYLNKYLWLVAKHDITNVNVAVKIINKKKMKNSKMSTKIKREIKLLGYFNHPNIIRLYEVLSIL